MAIPIGTTARQLAEISRWVLAGVFMLGMVSWWAPGYFAWGGLMIGLFAVLAMWLLWRTVAADRTVPMHPIHLVLGALLIVVLAHLTHSGLGLGRSGWSLAGSMDMSMFFHLLLLILAVMFSQSLLPTLVEPSWLLSIFGAGMMVGAGMGLLVGGGQGRDSLGLLGFAGVLVWLSPIGELARTPKHPAGSGLRVARIAWPIVAAVGSGLFAVAAPRSALLAVAVLAGSIACCLAAIGRRWVANAVAVGLVAVAGAILAIADGLNWAILRPGPGGIFGRGEDAFHVLWGGDSGLAVLGATTGWVGIAIVVGGSLGCLFWLLGGAHRLHGYASIRPILWVPAACLAGCALLAPGGWFAPAVTIAVAFTWGLLPTVLGRPSRNGPGVVLVMLLVLLMLLLGLVQRGGLAHWSSSVYGADDKAMHAVAGFLFAMSLAWLIGSRCWWAGLIGIGLAAAAGGAGEALQTVLSRRTGQMTDWQAHAIGSGLVVVPYLLAVGARWCESPDAKEKLKAEN